MEDHSEIIRHYFIIRKVIRCRLLAMSVVTRVFHCEEENIYPLAPRCSLDIKPLKFVTNLMG